MLNQAQSLQDVTFELDEMEKKLEKLREEKHRLFNELKKVSREEDERRQRDAASQQLMGNWAESRKPTSYGSASEGDGVLVFLHKFGLKVFLAWTNLNYEQSQKHLQSI